MNTLIISSSLSKNSRSLILCQKVAEKLRQKNVHCKQVDARNISMNPFHNIVTDEMKRLAKQIEECDNLIIGMGIHNYSINDSLKVLIDTCFSGAKEKFFGVLCAAGGDRSYLATMHLTQICMSQWRMIQLPRIIYATRLDFDGNIIKSNELIQRIDEFSEEFFTLGTKLL